MSDDEDLCPDWLFEDDHPDSYFMPLNALTYTQPEVVRRVYSLGRTISSVFRESGLTYWSSGGTTLGIVRHRGLIPWDDDIDICVLEKDEKHLESLVAVLADLGYTLQPAQPYSWKIFHTTESDPIKNDFYTHRFPFCDVFVMRELKGRFVLKDKTGQNAWPDEFYTKDQIENITEREYGDFSLCCPGSPETYLDRTYGPDWSQLGATHYFCHKSAGLVRQTYFTIQQDMFLPAQPFH